MCTVTPSCAEPGSNWYVTGRTFSPWVHVVGWSSSAMLPALSRSSSSSVKVSRSGVWRRAFFHHVSKWRPDTTSAGIRLS